MRRFQDGEGLHPLSTLVRNLRTIVSDGLRFFLGVWRGRAALATENLFLRKQLALFRDGRRKRCARLWLIKIQSHLNQRLGRTWSGRQRRVTDRAFTFRNVEVTSG